MMTGFFVIVFLLFLFFGVLLSLIRPIVQWVYYEIVDLLISLGMKEPAAKALVSLIILILILKWIF